MKKITDLVRSVGTNVRRMYGVRGTEYIKSILTEDSKIDDLFPTHRASSEHLCPDFGLAPRFFVWAPHFTSAYGSGRRRGKPYSSLWDTDIIMIWD